MWITESLGGTGEDGRTLVTKNSYRMLHTLYNLHPSPEPNLTVLWSKHLPENWKRFVAKVSLRYRCHQYESDTVMRPHSVTITPLPAASPPCASAKICSSSVHAQTFASCSARHQRRHGRSEKRPASRLKCLSGRTNTSISTASLNRLDFYRDWLAK